MRLNKSGKAWAEPSPKNQRNYFGRHLTSKSQQAQIESVQKRKKQKNIGYKFGHNELSFNQSI